MSTNEESNHDDAVIRAAARSRVLCLQRLENAALSYDMSTDGKGSKETFVALAERAFEVVRSDVDGAAKLMTDRAEGPERSGVDE